MILLAWVALACALAPALLYLWNSLLFREPPQIVNSADHPRISVLIPARNEERGIAACVESVLASRHVELEVIVLDDHSTDRTSEIVQAIATTDPRVRVEAAPSLPSGWCGKQAACFALSRLAQYEILTFVDADVRLAPDALARMALFMKQSRAELVSGFPQQETKAPLEGLLIPLIHWILLSFLPLWAMRRFRWSAFGAGCGQWFMTSRTAYEAAGGHAAVKASLHDGLTLPRAFRRAGFMTDLCDARNIATCRMYHTGREVWLGLAKNAREGMAATGQILFWTIVLFLGQVVPFSAMIGGLPWPDFGTWLIVLTTMLMNLTIQLLSLCRFQQSPGGALLFPLAILLLLAIQWYAIIRAIRGQPVGWKGRSHPTS